MNIYACGLNHKTAPLVIREHFMKLLYHLNTPLKMLHAHPLIVEIVLLNTCNRTEIYCVTDKEMDIASWLLKSIQQHICVTSIIEYEYKNYTYTYQGAPAIEHMLRVASGLESLILGEPQIMGQLKQAVAQARNEGTIGPILSKLFDNFVFYSSKHIRTKTGLSKKPISIASVSLKLAKQIFPHFHSLKGVFIGASDMNYLAMRHFYKHGMRHIYLANRTLHAHAKNMANATFATLIPLVDLSLHLADANIIVSATKAPFYLIEPAMLQQKKLKRRNKLLLLDLAIPRNINPKVNQLKEVFLYTIEDLQNVIGQHLAERSSAAKIATIMIKDYTNLYIEKIDEYRMQPLIVDWRQQHQQIAEKELAFITKKLSAGMDSHTALQQLAYRLTQKFLHHPTLILKKLGAMPPSHHHLSLLEELFYSKKSGEELL